MEKLITFCKNDYFTNKLMKFIIFNTWWVVTIVSLILGYTTVIVINHFEPALDTGTIVFGSLLFSMVWFFIVTLLSIGCAFKWLDGNYKKVYNKINS